MICTNILDESFSIGSIIGIAKIFGKIICDISILTLLNFGDNIFIRFGVGYGNGIKRLISISIKYLNC